MCCTFIARRIGTEETVTVVMQDYGEITPNCWRSVFHIGGDYFISDVECGDLKLREAADADILRNAGIDPASASDVKALDCDVSHAMFGGPHNAAEAGKRRRQ